MSEVDNFETLSNADLRAKCKEHGLPNVPVTDTSRKVLIKKLRASLSGASSPAAAAKKTNRRETIHVASKVYPSIDAVKAATGVGSNDVGGPVGGGVPLRAANRRTIAATQSFSIGSKAAAAEEVAPPRSTSPPQSVGVTRPLGSTVSRRSVREVHRSTVVDDNVPSVILESDSEDDDMIIEAARRAERTKVTGRQPDVVDADTFVRPRTSRSVSLSKTGVLTTSYLQDVAPLPLVIADDEESDNSLADNVRNKKSLQPTRAYEQRFTSNFSQSLSSRPISSATVAAAAPAASLFSTTPSSLYKSQQQPPPPQQPSRYTMGATAATTTSRYGAAPASSYFSPQSQSTVRSVTTTSGYATGSASAGSAAYRADQSDDTDTNNEDDQPQQPYDTPYLSNFARTLDRMKAEPLGPYGSGDAPPEAGELSRRYRPSSKSAVYQAPGRRPRIGSDGGDVAVRDIFLALEQKYHLKRNLVILLIFLLFVFLFVLFWQ